MPDPSPSPGLSSSSSDVLNNSSSSSSLNNSSNSSSSSSSLNISSSSSSLSSSSQSLSSESSESTEGLPPDDHSSESSSSLYPSPSPDLSSSSSGVLNNSSSSSSMHSSSSSSSMHSSSSSSSSSASSSSSSSGPLEWKAWPGGQASTSLNPTESFSSSDFGFSGNCDWDVGNGGINGYIVETGGTTATGRSSITVRYDTQSPTSSEANTVWIEATQGGSTETMERTVFKVSWDPGNFLGDLDDDNTRLFSEWSGTNRDKAEFNWDGDNGAERTSAKMEAILNFAPTGIDWTARGVSFVHGWEEGKSKFALQRLLIATDIGQLRSGGNRTIVTNNNSWRYDDISTDVEVQYPTVSKPNKAFSLDDPSFDAAAWKQISIRIDFRELALWHDGSEWSRCSEYLGWYANESSVLPDGTEGGDPDTNKHGPGTAGNVSNTRPVANAGSDQGVTVNSGVTLDGSASSDADNDTLTYSWRQISGTSVTLSDPTAEEPTFTAPGSPDILVFGLKVSDITKELHHHNPNTYESTEDTVTITVTSP